jgi:hypothetical protein
MVRAMLFHSKLPQSFWGEAIATASYIKNLLPNSAIDNKTLYEKWFNKPPRYDHLHPFGCIVYVHIPPERQPKLNKYLHRSKKGCFLEYVSHNIFRYYDFARQCVDTSHNFYRVEENEFPTNADLKINTPSIFMPTSRTLPTVDQIIHDMIIVEPPPSIQAFSAMQLPNQLLNQLLNQLDEPLTYHNAITRSDADKWVHAMHPELQSIENNNTWTLCDLLAGRRCIGSKWVFKKKQDGNNFVQRYKARIVAKGYSQIAGLDFEETFAPVVRIESVRTLFAISAFFSLYILHLDCKTAFLNGNSDLDLYIQQPEGFIDKRYSNKVLCLNKSLYGLKQAPRIWYLLLCSQISNLDFESCASDTSIYYSGQLQVVLAVYVDDILIFGNTKGSCEAVYHALSTQFKMENLGEPKTFLGLNIIRTPLSISINQSGYINRMLSRFKISNCVPPKIPLDPSLPLLKATATDKHANQLEYQEITGSLNHLAVFSCPDISNALSVLS